MSAELTELLSVEPRRISRARHWSDFGEGEYLGTAQVAQYLRRSPSTVRHYIKCGWLVPDATMPRNRLGHSGRLKFKKSTVIAFEHKLWEAAEKGCSISGVCSERAV